VVNAGLVVPVVVQRHIPRTVPAGALRLVPQVAPVTWGSAAGMALGALCELIYGSVRPSCCGAVTARPRPR